MGLHHTVWSLEDIKIGEELQILDRYHGERNTQLNVYSLTYDKHKLFLVSSTPIAEEVTAANKCTMTMQCELVALHIDTKPPQYK